METLYDAPTYPEPILTMIWRSGSLGIAIANCVDAGLAGESHQTADPKDIRGRISAPSLPDAGDIGEDSGHGQFFAGGDRHNVGLQPGATKPVEGAHDIKVAVQLAPKPVAPGASPTDSVAGVTSGGMLAGQDFRWFAAPPKCQVLVSQDNTLNQT